MPHVAAARAGAAEYLAFLERVKARRQYLKHKLDQYLAEWALDETENARTCDLGGGILTQK